MPRSLTLTIPRPCSESWAAMTPATQGRHCAACAKTVVDFSRMTDAEVLAYLNRAKGRSCGRFRVEQLSRPLRVAPVASVAQRWVAASLAMLGLGGALPAVAQVPHPQTPTHQTITMGLVAAQPQAVMPIRVMRGCVTDADTGQGLPGVTVLVEGTRHGISTQADGTYELAFPASMSNPRLVFSSIGFETVVEPIGHNSTLKAVNMKMNYTMMGEVVYTGAPHWYTPRGLWQRLTRPFRR